MADFFDSILSFAVMQNVCYEILQSILTPLSYPFDPARRVFWICIISSLLLAAVVYVRTSKTPSWVGFWRGLGSPSIWLHPSALLDYRLVFINAGIKAMVIAPILVSKLAVIVWVSGSLRDTFGTVTPPIISSGILLFLFTLILFLAEDFSRFLLHWMMHRLPWLWRFHRTHHTAEVLTPLTLYRQHPIELVLAACRSVFVMGAVTGVLVFFFPTQLTVIEILGVELFGFIFNLMGANLRHSHVRLSFGRLNHWFVSPWMHQIHHSSDPSHHNCNFGSCLAIWDSWWGTRRLPADSDMDLQFGCTYSGGSKLVTTRADLGRDGCQVAALQQTEHQKNKHQQTKHQQTKHQQTLYKQIISPMMIPFARGFIHEQVPQNS